MNALIAFGFPVVARYTQAAPFWFFAAATGLQFLVVWRFFPETRGVTLEAMEDAIHNPEQRGRNGRN
jgi:hypothetical protein